MSITILRRHVCPVVDSWRWDEKECSGIHTPQKVVAKISQEILEEMVGTTRSRVDLFMNKFRKRGFIRYNGGLHIDAPLLSVVLHESEH